VSGKLVRQGVRPHQKRKGNTFRKGKGNLLRRICSVPFKKGERVGMAQRWERALPGEKGICSNDQKTPAKVESNSHVGGGEGGKRRMSRREKLKLENKKGRIEYPREGGMGRCVRKGLFTWPEKKTTENQTIFV